MLTGKEDADTKFDLKTAPEIEYYEIEESALVRIMREAKSREDYYDYEINKKQNGMKIHAAMPPTVAHTGWKYCQYYTV